MADKLEIYHHGSSVCAAKLRFYLAEKDLPRKVCRYPDPPSTAPFRGDGQCRKFQQ